MPVPTAAPKKKKRPIIKLKITEAHDQPNLQANPTSIQSTINDTVDELDKCTLEPTQNPSSIHQASMPKDRSELLNIDHGQARSEVQSG